MPAGFVRVAKASDLPERRCRKFAVGDEQIALWRVGGRFYAVSDFCAHQHAPTIHRGMLSGLTVTCPLHGWTFSLETGAAETGDGRLRTFRVLVEDDAVYVEDPAAG